MSHLFRKSHSHAGSVGVGGALLGLAAGAAVAYYLYGTEAGEEKREQIQKLAGKIKDKVSDAKETVVELTDRKDDYVELASRIKDHLKEMKDDIEETLG